MPRRKHKQFFQGSRINWLFVSVVALGLTVWFFAMLGFLWALDRLAH